jgi:hypothetical protein
VSRQAVKQQQEGGPTREAGVLRPGGHPRAAVAAEQNPFARQQDVYTKLLVLRQQSNSTDVNAHVCTQSCRVESNKQLQLHSSAAATSQENWYATDLERSHRRLSALVCCLNANGVAAGDLHCDPLVIY